MIKINITVHESDKIGHDKVITLDNHALKEIAKAIMPYITDNARRYISHIGGIDGKTEPHFWPQECETCAEIAEFINFWETDNKSEDV